MKKADFLKAAKAAGNHLDAQIEWLESQDPGDHDRAWLQALNAIEKERSLVWDKIETLKAKGHALEQKGGRVREAFWAVEGNAFDTIRENGLDIEQLENQLWLWQMATNDEAIASWLEGNPE